MIKYYFYFSASHPPQPCAENLLRKGLVQGWLRKVNPMGVFSHYGQARGLVLEIQQILQYSKYPQTVERLFQIKSNMKAVFHIEDPSPPKQGPIEGTSTMVQIVSALLGMNTEDALLLSKHHDVLLRRREGMLLLNKEIGFWSPVHLSGIQLPYEWRLLPTPLRE